LTAKLHASGYAKLHGKLKDEAKLDEKAKKKQADDIVKMCKDIQAALQTPEAGLG
jgi:hypothetical protein